MQFIIGFYKGSNLSGKQKGYSQKLFIELNSAFCFKLLPQN
jgi:hypothetical protein